MRKALAVVLGLFVLFGAGMVAFEAQAQMTCTHYENSRLVDWPDYGYVCAFTGNGCTECYEIVIVSK